MSDSGTKRRISPDTLTDIAKRRRSKDGDTDEVPQQFTLPSQLGELDLFSILPDDCLLSVISYVDRDTLDLMERISQKMNCIVNQKGFVKQKKVVDAFEIAHYALYVSPQRVNFSATRSKLVYSVTGKKSMLSIGTGVITMSVPEAKEVPDNFFQVMEELFHIYSPIKLLFVGIILDERFFEKLVLSFHGNVPKALELMTVSVPDPSLFTTFLLKCKISNLEVSLCDEAIGSIFDEKFVREFSQIEVKEQQLDICLDTTSRWTCSTEFLPVFTRYKKLYLSTLTTTFDQVKKLIPIGFEQTLSSITWHFKIDEIPEIRNLTILGKVSNDFGCWTHVIIRKHNRICELTFSRHSETAIVRMSFADELRYVTN